MTETNQTLLERLRAAAKQLNTVFIQRQDAVHLLLLAELTRSNYIFVGDPGTAKSALIRCWLSHFSDATVFTTLCGSFATEDKIFGPVDIKGFQAGKWGRVTTGRLADVTHANLEEVLKSNDGTLNSLLNVLNERHYEGTPVPLRVCGSSTNWPEVRSRSERVAALWDRFILRCVVKEVEGEPAQIALLEAAEKVDTYQPAVRFTVQELDEAHRWIAANVSISTGVRRMLVKIRERLLKQEVQNSGRRMAQVQNVLRAKAYLEGRTEVTLEDFGVLQYLLWHDFEHVPVVDAVIDSVDQETVQGCVSVIDTAMREFDRIKNMAPQRRLEESPRVIARMRDAATEVHKRLQDTGATAKGRQKIAKSMAGLKSRFDELSTEVNAQLSK